MKKSLISILMILLVSVFVLSSCEMPNMSNDDSVMELQEQIDRLNEELDEAKSEIEEKNEIIQEKDKEIFDLSDEIEALKAENANLALQNEALEGQIQDLLNDKDYTVTFDINGGAGEVPSQIVRYKKTVDEPAAPTKEHYDFVGWYVGDEKAEFPYVVTAHTDFVAHYAPAKYTIIYEVNGGTMPDTYTSQYTVEEGASLPTPTRSLYLFDGWYEDEDFSGEKVTEIFAGEFGNKAFYAKWLSTTNGIKYQLSDDKSYYTVTGYEGSDTVVVIPDNIDGIPVTAIAESAFKGKQRITSITVPDSVTSIGNSAFRGCISLVELNIGNGINSIPVYMAYGCNKLMSIKIPGEVTTIGYGAFYECSGLTEIVIPDSVISIEGYAFAYCSGLTDVVIPDNVASIGGSAFTLCTSLESVVIGDSVTSISGSAFYKCSSLESVVIGESVASIDDSAFFACSSLKSVVIPDSVTTIISNAFAHCTGLTSVFIGKGVTSISTAAFYNCTNLREVHNYSGLLIEKGSTNNGSVAYYAVVVINYN